MEAIETKYYDIDKTMSYNAPITVIDGVRSLGKTYSFTKHCINKYIKSGCKSQFGWIRRTDDETKLCKGEFFSDMEANDEFPDYEFQVVGREAQIRPKVPEDVPNKSKPAWATFGYFFSASMYQSYKGGAYPNVNTLVYDEYIIEDTRYHHYLSDDVGAILSIYTTVARKRNNVKLYVLSNSVNITNPLYLWMGVTGEPKSGYTWYKKHDVLYHHETGEIYSEQAADTLIGRLTKGSALEGIMVTNTFNDAHNSFIDSKTKNAKYRFGFVCFNEQFGVWCDMRLGLYYVNRKVINRKILYALTTQDYRPNMLLITKARPLLKNLVKLYSVGVVRFDTAATREAFLKVLKLIGV